MLSKILLASSLTVGLIAVTLQTNTAIAKDSNLNPIPISSKKVLGKILASEGFIKSKHDKKLVSHLLKNSKKISGLGLYRSQLSNRTIAKRFPELLTPKGAKCLHNLKTQVVAQADGSDVYRCGKDTFLLTLNGDMDVEDAIKDGADDVSAFFLDAVIVVIAAWAVYEIMTDELSDEIKPGTLAEDIYCSTNDCDDGDSVMAGPCGPNQSPGHDGLCGDLR